MIELTDPDALDYAGLIRPGDHLVSSQGAAEPVALTSRLVAQRHALPRIELFVGPCYGSTFGVEHADRIGMRSYCGTGGNARLLAAGMLDVVPSHISEFSALFRQRRLRCDVALLSACEDGSGRYNLGLANDYVIDAARQARLVIVEASSRFPCVAGAQLPRDITPDVVVRTEREPLELAADPGSASDDEKAVARQVAGLVGDGATLELGIGRLPELVLGALHDRRDLGVHSAIVGDGVADLVERGVITNARKAGADRGISVGHLLWGTRRAYRWAHRNPAVRLAPSSVTHSIDVARTLPDYTAINGAIEIDLMGQVNSETMAGRYVGAVGGQLDFTRAGNAAPGGRAILMLPSTAKGGTINRIVPRLADGLVTTPRSDVQWVVTEWGVAHLWGLAQRERARALIAIAHPSFREELERHAHAMFASART